MRWEQLPHWPLALFTVCLCEKLYFHLCWSNWRNHVINLPPLPPQTVCGNVAHDECADWKPVESFKSLINQPSDVTILHAAPNVAQSRLNVMEVCVFQPYTHALNMNANVSAAEAHPEP